MLTFKISFAGSYIVFALPNPDIDDNFIMVEPETDMAELHERRIHNTGTTTYIYFWNHTNGRVISGM